MLHWLTVIYQNAVTSIVNVSEQLTFEANSVTVTLEWSTKNSVTYTINTDPQVAVNQTGLGRNSAQLTVSYNTRYNVSIVASLCGTNRTTLIVLNYGKLHLSVIAIADYRGYNLGLTVACSEVPSTSSI